MSIPNCVAITVTGKRSHRLNRSRILARALHLIQELDCGDITTLEYDLTGMFVCHCDHNLCSSFSLKGKYPVLNLLLVIVRIRISHRRMRPRPWNGLRKRPPVKICLCSSTDK